MNEINNIGLDIRCYDDGSNMKEKYQGVQKRILDINLGSFYTPCGYHG